MIPCNRNHSVVAESLFSLFSFSLKSWGKAVPSLAIEPRSFFFLTPPTGHISSLHFLQTISGIHFDHSQLFWGLVGDRLLFESLISSPKCLRLPRASPASGTRGFPVQGTAQTRSWGVPSLPHHSASPQGLQTVPARLLGDPAQALEGTATPGRSPGTGSTLCASTAEPHLASQHLKNYSWKFISTLAEDSLCHCRSSQEQMRFQPHSSSTRCPLPAPSQEEADASLGFSPPLRKNPRLGLTPFGQSWDLASPRRGWAGCVRAQSTPMWESRTLGANLGSTVPALPHMPQSNIPVLPNHFDLITITQKPASSWGLWFQAVSGSQNCALSASISHKSVDFNVHAPEEEL